MGWIDEYEKTLHGQLMARLPESELARRRALARRKAHWTQEDVDLAIRIGKRRAAELKWE